MIRSRITILAIALLCIVPFISRSQNNTSSPYSYFGIGDIASVGYGRNLALGGTGLGIRDPHLLNLKNPASLTAIDSMSFLFDMGVNCQLTYSSSVDYNIKFWDGNLTHLAFGHRYTNWLMACVGLMPYSNIGYRFRTFKSVQGEDNYILTDWEGSGGINKLFYSLGFKLSNHLSLGTEVGYYYGPISRTLKTYVATVTENPCYLISTYDYKSLSFKLAGQYTTPLGQKGSMLTIGGYFSPGQRFSGVCENLVEQNYNSSALDTIYYNMDDVTSINAPITYGAGVGLNINNKYQLTADVDLSNWSSVNSNKTYIDQKVISAGFEFLPQRSLKYLQRCAYRFGYRYDGGYVQTRGFKIDDMRVSVGMGLPVLKTPSMINVTLEAGQRGTTKMSLVRERYVRMTAAFSLQEIWFFKRKVE